jgi:16S rRNA (guanine966-N2)-methyltransferase
MRVTGGSVRGRRLATFRGLDIRPTSDRVREAIFDLLGQDLSGKRVLDLFAGTGSLGIEALSRGAVEALFIDHSLKAIELIQKNLKLCGLEGSGFVLRKNLSRGLFQRHPALVRPFDLVFLDPPYGKGFLVPLLEELDQRGMLGSASHVVAQSEKKGDLPEVMGNLKTAKVRIYGATRISVFKNEEDS